MMEHTEKISYEGGIESYEGSLPAWLITLAVCLFLWGVYYLMTYWNGPVSTV